MNLEELIDEITWIKKDLIALEEMLRDCNKIDEETFKTLIGYHTCAYDDLARMKDILREKENNQ